MTFRIVEQDMFLPSELTVLRELQRVGSATRVALANSTGLSPQSLTRLTRGLIDRGLVVEGHRLYGGRGQPSVSLSIASGSMASFGLVLEHDQITCVASELTGEPIFRLQRRGDYGQASLAIEEAMKMVAAANEQIGEKALRLGIGISVSGLFMERDWKGLICRNDIEGWRKVDLRAIFEDKFGMPVLIENDGNIAAVGHSIHGAGSSFDSFFLVLMTKGIGGGFIHNGQLVRGRLGNAGDLGALFPLEEHPFKPTRDSLDAYLQEKWGYTPSTSQLERALQEKNRDLEDWTVKSGKALSSILSVVNLLFDPDAFILAGRLPSSLRHAIARNVEIKGHNYQNFQAPLPEMVVDPNANCLETGATSLPVSAFLFGR